MGEDQVRLPGVDMRVAQLVDLVEDGTKGGQAHSVQVGEEEVEAPVTTLI